MKWAAIAGITIVMLLIVLFEWPKLNHGSQSGQVSQGEQGNQGSQGNQSQGQKKDKAAFITLSLIAWLLAGLMVFYPDMPGPTELVDMLFKPLGRLLE